MAELTQDILDKAIAVRKELHNIPEISGHEEKTKALIKKILQDNTQLLVEDYKGGVIALYTSEVPTEASQNTIAFRADFDAVSLPDGTAAHLCGHDGHTAALLGVAFLLEKMQPKRNVLLIFQPAEETGAGAKSMVEALKKYSVSEVYACHNLPGYEFGKVYTRFDTFACASCGMTFYLSGEPSHAAYPEMGASPMRAVTALLNAIDESQNTTRFEAGTFATLIGCNVGQKAFGTSAEKAEIWVTVRSRTEEVFKQIREYLEAVVKNACEKDGVKYRLEILDEFPATVNHPECAEKILKKCAGVLLEEPMRWSEDFGHFLNTKENTKGAFFGIGAGPCPDLHTREYQYPDELLEYQINAFKNLL